MRKLLIAITSLLTIGVYNPTFAASNPSRTEKMETCFRMHGQLMDKPALRNVQACWRAHGYLMGR